jgi:hypothetical protein
MTRISVREFIYRRRRFNGVFIGVKCCASMRLYLFRYMRLVTALWLRLRRSSVSLLRICTDSLTRTRCYSKYTSELHKRDDYTRAKSKKGFTVWLKTNNIIRVINRTESLELYNRLIKNKNIFISFHLSRFLSIIKKKKKYRLYFINLVPLVFSWILTKINIFIKNIRKLWIGIYIKKNYYFILTSILPY